MASTPWTLKAVLSSNLWGVLNDGTLSFMSISAWVFNVFPQRAVRVGDISNDIAQWTFSALSFYNFFLLQLFLLLHFLSIYTFALQIVAILVLSLCSFTKCPLKDTMTYNVSSIFTRIHSKVNLFPLSWEKTEVEALLKQQFLCHV